VSAWLHQHAAVLEFWRLMWLGCKLGAYSCAFTWPL
jgi:hypothetical protein